MNNKIKPIYFRHTKGIADVEVKSVRDGIDALLKIIKLEHSIKIKNIGYWNKGDGEYESAEWYVKKSLTDEDHGYGKQIYDDRLLGLCSMEQEVNSYPYCDLFLIDIDLWSPGLNFVIGSSNLIGTVFSVIRFRNLSKQKQYECIKTETLHELGHVFGAAKGRAGVDALGEDPSDSRLYNNHCANMCVMRQGNRVPDAWLKMSEDRFKNGNAFCDACVKDMKNFLKL